MFWASRLFGGRFLSGRALRYNLFGDEKSPKRISTAIANANRITIDEFSPDRSNQDAIFEFHETLIKK